MARPPGRRDRSDNYRIISKPDHIGICCFQWLDSSKSYCSGASVEFEPRGRVGLAHWPCRGRRNDHSLRTIACSIEFADSTSTDLLQPLPDWPAGAACTEERVLVVPGTLLVCLRRSYEGLKSDSRQVGSRRRRFPNRRRRERRRSWSQRLGCLVACDQSHRGQLYG
jgi:hypothetical protein